MKEFSTRTMFEVAAVIITALALVQLASARAERQQTATIQVKGGEFFFKLTTKSVARPGTVTFVFKNVGHIEHDFKINRKMTPLISPGKTVKLVVSFKKKGTYPYLCTVDSHAALGMHGVFRVG